MCKYNMYCFLRHAFQALAAARALDAVVQVLELGVAQNAHALVVTVAHRLAHH